MAVPLRLLIVEDSEDDALLLVRELGRGGYDVTFERVDTAQALTAALDRRDWDLMIADYSMPHFSGTAALSVIKERDLDLPFIFVSGTIGEETAVAAMRGGAHDYIMKGKLARLVPAVQREMREVQVRRERKRFEQQVYQLQKFEAIGKLAGGIAHDFNNVIGVIMGWAEMGEQETSDDPPVQSHFKKIRVQAEGAAGLTRQLLAFARRQILEPRNINLNQAVMGTTDLLQKVIGEQIELKTVLAPDLEVTRADPTQIEQVIINLCVNARDAMPHGGRLLIETKNVELDAEDCRRYPYARPGRYVLLAVTDTGIGMDTATVEKIFEPFFTTKPTGQGTGLGLATVYGIVKQHNGFINADSQPGKGTTFRIYLPAGSGTAETRKEMDHELPRGGTETILVAEDHEGLREYAQTLLASLGYETLLAGDGQEAVRLFEANHDRIALVLLDLVMPKLGGLEAYKQMSRVKPALPAIFMTGYSAEVPLLQPLLEQGAVLLQKPYTATSLGKKIREMLDRRN